MLENIYKIDPAFNKDLALAYQPPPLIDVATLPTLPKNWLNRLKKIICEADSTLSPNCLNKHIGNDSSYRAKNILREQLQLIYHRLQGNFDSKLGKLSLNDRQILISRLTEEIGSCTEGFHNRVNIIVDSFPQPRNLAELVYTVRKSLVENVAAELTNEVHAWNGISVIAQADGFGIKANFPDDTYSGSLPQATIRRALQENFAKYFTPFLLPSLLINAFKELVPELEFEKKNQNGLCVQTQEKIISLTKQFLPEYINEAPKNAKDSKHWINYFKKIPSEKNSLVFSFSDVNWEKIYQSFYSALLDKKYFTQPKINTLMDSAYYHLFIDKKAFTSLEPLSQLFNEHQYYSLLTQLVELKARFPNFYKENLYKNKVLKNKCLAFNEFLIQQLKISKQYSAEIMLGFSLMFRLELRRETYKINQIAESLLVTNKSGFNLLMLGALNNLELVKDIFDFLKKYEAIISPEITEKMLLMKNRDHCNALMIAANKQREAINTIFGFLKTHIGCFANDTVFKLFTQQQKKDNYTALTLTACNNPDLFNSIFNFFKENLNGENFRKLLFPENSNGACTALMLAIKNKADTSLSILDYIAKNTNRFDPATLRAMFLEKDQNGCTILMLMIRHYPEMLTIFLKLLNKHSMLFHESFLSSLLLEKNSESYNFLMCAAEYQPKTIDSLLKFINQRYPIFKDHLNKLLFDTNNKGYNALMLSRLYPEVMMSILKFICNSEINLTTSIADIFFKKNNNGLSFLMLLAKDQPQSLKLILEFIETNPEQFTKENLLNLFQGKSGNGYTCLMLAARNHYDATVSILNFIQKQPTIFSAEIINQLIAAHDENRTNALMLAATKQPEVVDLLLSFLSKNIAPQGPISIDTIREIIFEKVHDKEAANAVLFGGRYGYYKSVLLVTSQLTDPTPVNALLKFIDYHIDSLGIEIFTDLLTEKDYQDNYIFLPACANYPLPMKKILNFLANSATHEALIPIQTLSAEFIFEQLVRWPIATAADLVLLDKVIVNCSALLLTYFNKDFFAQARGNLKLITDKLFACYLSELETLKLKKINYTTSFSFFKWRYSTTQKLEAALALQTIIDSKDIDTESALSQLKDQYPAIALCQLGNLFAAYQEIAKLQSIQSNDALDAMEFHIENDAILYKRNLAA